MVRRYVETSKKNMMCCCCMMSMMDTAYEKDTGIKTACQSVYFSDPWNSGTGTVVCNILWNPDDLKSHQFEIWNEL